MMGKNALIVFAHHERKSFHGALLDTAIETLSAQGYNVTVSDLHAMNFNPVSDRRNFTTVKDENYLKQQVEESNASEHDGFSPDIKAEMDKLFAADLLLFIFPLWWFGLPAILKGWVDRVFAMGTVYGGNKGWYDKGIFKGKKAFIALATGGPETSYSESGLQGDINMVLYPINHGILYFTGFTVLQPFIAYSVSRIGDEKRKEYLAKFKERLENIDSSVPIPYLTLDDYDDTLKRRVTDQ